MAETEKMLEAPAKYLASLNNKDLDGLVALYAEDATVEDPVGTDKLAGKSAIREFYKKAVNADVQAELTGEVRLSGMEVAFPFVARISSAGIETQIIDTFRFNEKGEVVEMRAFWGSSNTRPIEK
ncbi:MAG: nuclear transport factor 2 family protein [Pseudomonadales bacterium]